MKRQTRLILGFVPILGMTGVAAFLLGPTDSEEKPVAAVKWPLGESSIKAVDQIEIQKSQQRVVLQRKETLWRVAQPINTDVNAEKMESYLLQLSQISPQKQLAASQKQKEWGFEKPTASVVGNSAQGEPLFALTFGALNTFDQTVFTALQLPNMAIAYYSLPRLMAYRLGLTLDELREKRIWPVSDMQGLHVQFESKKPPFSFIFTKSASSAQGRRVSPYRLLAPIEGMGDEMRLGQLLRFLGQVEIDRIETENHQDKLAPWGLQKPAWKIKVQNGSMNLPLTISFGQRPQNPNDLYVTRGDVPWVGRLSIEHLSALNYNLEQITDKRLFTFEVKKVSRWEIFSKSVGRIILEKDKGEFTMLAPQPALVKKDAVHRSLLAFARMEGSQLVPTKPESFAKELQKAQKEWEVKMTFWDRHQKEMDALYLYPKSADVLYGIAVKSKRILVIPRRQLNNLPANIEAWIEL